MAFSGLAGYEDTGVWHNLHQLPGLPQNLSHRDEMGNKASLHAVDRHTRGYEVLNNAQGV